VAIFRAVRTRIQIQLWYIKVTPQLITRDYMSFNCGVILMHYNCICILVLTTLKMATSFIKICLWLLCNKITFINPSAFVGLLINLFLVFLFVNSFRRLHFPVVTRKVNCVHTDFCALWLLYRRIFLCHVITLHSFTKCCTKD